jgi:MFS family permease
VFLAASYAFLASVREPEGASPAEPVALGQYLRRMPGLLERDRNLSWYLVARGFGTVGTMANAFYTVYALRVFSAPEWEVGLLTTLYLGGQMVGNAGLGWLADRAGHRAVLAIGLGAMATANVIAAGASAIDTLAAVLALTGLHQASVNISARTILLELAPDAERPTYIGLANTALAPLTFTAPLVAGLMADRLGFPVVFVCAAVISTISLVVLMRRVRDPRHLAPAA